MSTASVPDVKDQPKSRTQEKIATLQLLRFLAATLVMIGHFQHEIVIASPQLARAYGFIPLDWGLGVDIFFVISGFVMFFLAHENFGKPGASGHFMRRRLIRIVPLYWFFTTVTLAIAVATSGSTGGDPLYLPNVIASYLFLPGPRCGEYCFPVYTLGWTLNYEMLFYVLVAVGLKFPRSTGLTVVIVSIAALMLARIVTPPSMTMIHFWGLSIVAEFLLGMAICHLFLSGMTLGRQWAIMALAAGFALAILFYQIEAYAVTWRLITGGIPAALIVGGTVLSWRSLPASGLTRFLVGGGDASYALYLSHPFVAKAGAAVFARLGLWDVAPWLYLVAGIFGAIIVAFIIHHYFELPVTRWFAAKWAGKPLHDRKDHVHLPAGENAS